MLRPDIDRVRLAPQGEAASRHLELITRWRFGPERELFASYVHSRARSHLNEFAEFLGDYPSVLVREDAYGPPPGNIPHRFLVWGSLSLAPDITRSPAARLFPPSPRILQPGRGWRVAPVLEWRSGFPFSVFDAAQRYAEPPNHRRFPRFFSLDFRLSKDVPAGGQRVARISFSVFNLTNHFNPDSVRWNVAEPRFGEFLGRQPRRFRADFDIYF